MVSPGWGVSPEVVAALLGVTVGVVVERPAGSLGRLRFEASVKSLMLTGFENEPGYPRDVPLEEADEDTRPTVVATSSRSTCSTAEKCRPACATCGSR